MQHRSLGETLMTEFWGWTVVPDRRQKCRTLARVFPLMMGLLTVIRGKQFLKLPPAHRAPAFCYTVHGVAKSWTRLSEFHLFLFCFVCFFFDQLCIKDNSMQEALKKKKHIEPYGDRKSYNFNLNWLPGPGVACQGKEGGLKRQGGRSFTAWTVCPGLQKYSVTLISRSLSREVLN